MEEPQHAYGAGTRRTDDAPVQVLIYGKGHPRAHGCHALMFVVYQRRPGIAGKYLVLVATAAYDVQYMALLCLRAPSRSWKAASSKAMQRPVHSDLTCGSGWCLSRSKTSHSG